MTIVAIAADVGVSLRTVQRWLACADFPERQPRAKQSSLLDPYKPYLLVRWQAGCWNATQLYREIHAQGYPGTKSLVFHYCQRMRKAQGMAPKQRSRPGSTPTATPTMRPASAQQLVWLVMRREEHLTAEDRRQRALLPNAHPDIDQAIILSQRFLKMARARAGDALEQWLREAETSVVRPIRRFADGLRRDQAAVAAGLSLTWSTGPVEGQINRIKTVKRQMYGRAKLDLLKQRLLAIPPDAQHRHQKCA